MKKVPYRNKMEEFTPFSSMVLDSYTNDRPKFFIFSPTYDEKHLLDCNTRLGIIDKIINPDTVMVQMKNATQMLYAYYDDTLTFVDQLERYVDKAGNKIPISLKDLGFSVIRTKCHSKDAEGVLGGLKKVKQLVEPHLLILEPLGYTTGKQEALTKLIKDISDTNTLRNSFYNQLLSLYQDNMGLINEFWNEVIRDILYSGKVVFKENPAKKKEYTQASIMKRVRHMLNTPEPNKGGTDTKG